MTQARIGYVSNITRVETWECDFNAHWNTRFYTRAFQYAAETVAQLSGQANPGATVMQSRHMRFYRELHPGDSVLVRSAAIEGGRWDGAIVHWLESDGRLSATALDLSGYAPLDLPLVSEQATADALPRGLLHDAPVTQDTAIKGYRANLGILRPSSFDHTGALMFDELFRYATCASYDHHVSLGYTPQFTAESGVGRMVVEIRVTWLGSARAGMAICSNSWLTHVKHHSFASAHHLETQQGEPIALIELCLLAVNMDSRRATSVPDFLRPHAGTNAPENMAYSA